MFQKLHPLFFNNLIENRLISVIFLVCRILRKVTTGNVIDHLTYRRLLQKIVFKQYSTVISIERLIFPDIF